MSQAKKQLRAGQMSMILVGVLIALLAVLIGGSGLAATLLLKKSSDATHAQIDAQISEGDVTRLIGLKQYLEKNASGISQTATLTNGLGQYDQNTIVGTLNSYANKAGVSITSFDFSSPAPSTATPSAPAASTAGTVNLTLGTSVPYKNFIVFLRLVEQGLMPATVTNGQISADPQSPGSVSVTGLSIKVTQ